MRYKKALFLCAATLLTLSFTGCGNSKTENTDTGANTEAAKTESDDGSIKIVSGGDVDANGNPVEKVTIRVGLLSGVNSYVASHLMDSNDSNSSYEQYQFTQSESASEICDKLKNGELDAAALPGDVAARLYNETDGGVQVATVSAGCNYYIAGIGGDVSDVSKLAGKTITLSKEDHLATAMLNIILESKDITDCTIAYVDNNKALVNGLSDGSIKLALIQEPFLSEASTKNANINTIVDLYDDWDDAADTALPTSCLVISKKATVPPSAIGFFLKDFDASVNMTRHSIDTTATMAERYKMASSASVAKAAIPGSSVGSQNGDAMKKVMSGFVTIMNQKAPEAIGNAVPAADFYYTAEE